MRAATRIAPQRAAPTPPPASEIAANIAHELQHGGTYTDPEYQEAWLQVLRSREPRPHARRR